MAKTTFLVGTAVGYVLGTRAGRKRYAQIKRTSSRLWNLGPVQRRRAALKYAAKTKAAPYVANRVGDAAKATGQRIAESARREPKPLNVVSSNATKHVTNAPDSTATHGENLHQHDTEQAS